MRPIRTMKAKRVLFSRLMLAVFLPVLLLSVLHIHDGAYAEGDSCTECVKHIPHAGHLSINANHYVDCVLCQFTSLSFLEAVTVAAAQVPAVHDAVVVLQPRPLLSAAGRISVPRAPPVVCYIL